MHFGDILSYLFDLNKYLKQILNNPLTLRPHCHFTIPKFHEYLFDQIENIVRYFLKGWKSQQNVGWSNANFEVGVIDQSKHFIQRFFDNLAIMLAIHKSLQFFDSILADLWLTLNLVVIFLIKKGNYTLKINFALVLGVSFWGLLLFDGCHLYQTCEPETLALSESMALYFLIRLKLRKLFFLGGLVNLQGLELIDLLVRC